MATRPDPIEEIEDRIKRLEAEFLQAHPDALTDGLTDSASVKACREVVRRGSAVAKARKELIAIRKATPKPR